MSTETTPPAELSPVKRALLEMYEREVEAASTGNNAHVAMKHPVAAA